MRICWATYGFRQGNVPGNFGTQTSVGIKYGVPGIPEVWCPWNSRNSKISHLRRSHFRCNAVGMRYSERKWVGFKGIIDGKEAEQ